MVLWQKCTTSKHATNVEKSYFDSQWNSLRLHNWSSLQALNKWKNLLSKKTPRHLIANTLGPAYNELKDAKETTHCKWVLVVTELLNIALNDFNAKKSVPYSRVPVVTELVNAKWEKVYLLHARKHHMMM